MFIDLLETIPVPLTKKIINGINDRIWLGCIPNCISSTVLSQSFISYCLEFFATLAFSCYK
jgi:hypothetical protein